MTDVQVCPECGQLFEYGVWHWKTELCSLVYLGHVELCSLECRAEYAEAEAERRRDWQRDELRLKLVEIEKGE